MNRNRTAELMACGLLGLFGMLFICFLGFHAWEGAAISGAGLALAIFGVATMPEQNEKEEGSKER